MPRKEAVPSIRRDNESIREYIQRVRDAEPYTRRRQERQGDWFRRLIKVHPDPLGYIDDLSNLSIIEDAESLETRFNAKLVGMYGYRTTVGVGYDAIYQNKKNQEEYIRVSKNPGGKIDYSIMPFDIQEHPLDRFP